MYLKPAWAKKNSPKTGIKKLDDNLSIGIGDIENNVQMSVYIGVVDSVSFNRTTTVQSLESDGRLPQEWVDYIASKPKSEFNYHEFYYPTTSGLKTFYRCLAEVCGRVECFVKIAFESKHAISALGYVKSLTACNAVKGAILSLHSECMKVEYAARVLAKDVAIKNIISKRIEENRERKYFDLSDVTECMLVANKNGWSTPSQLNNIVSKM